MKEKLIIFIVGLLLGTIISSGSIYFYTVTTNSNSNNQCQRMQMNGGARPNMPGDQNGNRPEIPNNTQDNSETNSN